MVSTVDNMRATKMGKFIASTPLTVGALNRPMVRRVLKDKSIKWTEEKHWLDSNFYLKGDPIEVQKTVKEIKDTYKLSAVEQMNARELMIYILVAFVIANGLYAILTD